MRTIFVFVLATLAIPGLTFGEAHVTTGPIVKLPPVQVDEFSSYLGFEWKANLEGEKIATLRFARVDPRSLASRAGIVENDDLKMIDGHPVKGMALKDLQAFFARDWKPGEIVSWEFVVTRGAVFTREYPITLRMRTKPVEDTSQPIAPTNAGK